MRISFSAVLRISSQPERSVPRFSAPSSAQRLVGIAWFSRACASNRPSLTWINIRWRPENSNSLSSISCSRENVTAAMIQHHRIGKFVSGADACGPCGPNGDVAFQPMPQKCGGDPELGYAVSGILLPVFGYFAIILAQ
jgi:hypothetical protein